MAFQLIALAVAAVVLTAISVYAATQALPPDEATGASRKLTTSSDAENPWTLVYGDRIVGGHVAWAGVRGGDQEETGVDYILASHPCDVLLSVQAGNIYLPIVTNPAAAEGLILNVNRAPPDGDYPNDWLVPVLASAFWTKDQAKSDDPDKKSHIAIKVYYGTQTATDTKMAERFGDKYTDAGARKFIGHTVAHCIFRANDNLGTLSGVPSMRWRIKGKNDIALNDSGSTTGYTANAAAVLADAMKMFSGVAAAEIVNHAGSGLASLITACNTTAWDPQGTAARYEYHDEIRWDEEPIEVYTRIAKHMMGGFSERGDKIVFWTGTARNPVMTLTEADFAGEATTDPVKDDDWVNTYRPHRFVRTALDDEGNLALHGEMEPARKATQASYVTEDGGVELIQDIFFEGCDLARRARDLAHIALDTIRISSYYARYTRKYRKRALVLEVGDVFSTTDPTRLSGATEFRCVAKSAPDADWAVEITGVPYADSLYDQRAVTEDEVGVLARGRSPTIPALSGLAISVLEGSENIQPNGKIKIDVLVSWSPITNIQLRAGDVQVAWKKSSTEWPGRSTVAAADEPGAIAIGLVYGTDYDFRARIVASTGTAGRRDRRTRGNWANLTDQTIEGDFLELPGPPGTGVTGSNEVVDGNLERGPNANTWDLVDESGTLPGGAATIETTGGKYGPHRLMITGTASATNQFYRARNQAYIAVTAGEWRQLRMAVKKRASSNNIEAKMVALFYNADADPPVFISAHDTIRKVVSNTAWQASRRVGETQVPDDPLISAMRIEVRLESETSSGTAAADFDGFSCRELIKMSTPKVETLVEVGDGTWTNLVSLVGFDSGAPETQIYFDGEDSIEFSAYVEASVKRNGATDVTGAGARAVARLRLEAVGGSTTSIVDQKLIAVLRQGDAASGQSSEIDTRRLIEYVVPVAGNYKVHLEGRCVGDDTNGTAQFHRYWIRLVK